jgi:hypothetical protein
MKRNALILALLFAAIATPVVVGFILESPSRGHGEHRRHACINNLRRIDGAKQEWALVEHKATNDTPAWSDIEPLLRQPRPVCPAGGVYTLGQVWEVPKCSLKGHDLPQ